MTDTIERAELRDKRSRMQSEIQALEDAHDGTVRNARWIDGPPWTAGDRERVANLRRGIEKIDAAMEALDAPEREARLAAVLRLAQNPNSRVDHEVHAMTTPAITQRERIVRAEPQWDHEVRTAALRAIDAHRGRLSADDGDRLSELVRQPEAIPEARYLAAIGDEAYFRAFAKVIRGADPAFAKLYMTADEEAAWDAVTQARSERGTALAIGVGATGGFALPFDLDPTLHNTATGANCPLRRLARVQTLTVNARHYVSADGVIAGYGAEASAMSEGGPTYAQPTLTAARGSAFITASYEALMDYEALVSDLAMLIADGRDTVDATKFLSGSGTNEPLGILTIGTAGALTTTQRVQTASADAVVAADVYSVLDALPPRFQSEAAWTVSPSGASFFYRATPVGSTTEPQLIPVYDGPMLGRPVHKWSTMATPAASGEQTGNKVAIVGDFQRGVTIGDRLGMTIEIIPNMLDGATPSFPTGQRGIVGWWRTGLVVHNTNALRYLEVK